MLMYLWNKSYITVTILLLSLVVGCNPQVDDGDTSSFLGGPWLGNNGPRGCMEPLASNYNENAKQDDGSCSFRVCGDTSSSAYGSFQPHRTAFSRYRGRFPSASLVVDNSLCNNNSGDSDPGTGDSGSGNGDGPADGGGDHISCNNNASKNNPWFNDPFFCHQWQIRNVGQRVPTAIWGGQTTNSLSSRFLAGTAGADIQVGEIYNQGHFGDGIKVYVTDDGILGTHEDLADNFIGAYNFCNNQQDPQALGVQGTHGTMVTGLFGAVANNGIGMAGISPKVRFYGNNLISDCQHGNSTTKFRRAILDQVIGYDVWNGSFGSPTTLEQYQRRLNSTYSNYRTGAETHDITYIKANGNWGGNPFFTSGNGAPDGSIYTIAHIAAIDNRDVITSFSSLGANLLLAGSSGDVAANIAGTCTTTYGQSGSNNRANAYTCSMGGTSSATPVVTGVAALVREANSQLKWHDVHAILAMSAKDLNEPAQFPCGPNSNRNSRQCIRKITNGAGYKHSYMSGLGTVNAEAAVNLAKNFTPLPPLQTYSQARNNNTRLSASGGGQVTTQQCRSLHIDVAHDFQVYALELSFAMSGGATGLARDFDITMKMPDGVWAQVIHPHGVNNPNQRSLILNSNYFKSMQAFGINARGQWEFKACMRSGSAQFTAMNMEIFGWSNGNPLPTQN